MDIWGSSSKHQRRFADRLSRRRFAAGAVGVGLAAAAAGLVGCSSSTKNNTGGAKQAASGTAADQATAASQVRGTAAAATSTPAALDSTKGKPGGTLKIQLLGYPSGFNPVSSPSANDVVGFVYGSLLAQAWGQESVDSHDYFNLEPDLAQALPEQPDDTTYVFKLRPGVKFHNGRVLTSEDVRYSFDRYANDPKSLFQSAFQNWLDHVETPDPQTAVVKMKFPYADALVTTAGNQYGWIVAKEFQESPDVQNKMMGTGPFLYSDSLSPISITYKKNPDYYLKPYPYFDSVQAFVAQDPVKRVTDFTTGQVQLTYFFYPDDRDQIKQQRPDAKIQNWESYAPSIIMRTDKPPFNDKRVRQALSMGINRKNLRDLTGKGEGRSDQYFTYAYQSLFGFHEVKDLGAAAKYWDYDVQTAKQLLAAAGVTKPVEAQMSHFNAAAQGQWFVDMLTLAQTQWKQDGLANIQDNPLTIAQSTTTVMVGNYEGMGVTPSTAFGQGAPAFTRGVHDQYFWGPNGEHATLNQCYVNNPQLNDLVDKQLRQLKLEDRKQTYLQMEPIIAEEQYRIVFSTGFHAFFWDPSLRNVRMPLESGSRRYTMRWWFA